MKSRRCELFRAGIVRRAAFVIGLLGADGALAGNTQLTVTAENGDLLPCRIHLTGPDGKPHQPENFPSWRGHFVCPGTADLTLEKGEYAYLIERGPEHQRVRGRFEKADENLELPPIVLRRHTDLQAQGWFAGDLHVHRDPDDLPLLMKAEDLHIAPVITWWRDRNLWEQKPLPENPLTMLDGGNRCYRVLGGEDERNGGALLFFNLPKPIDITGSSSEFPSPMKFLNQVSQIEGAWIDIEKPFWWDVPVWLASGKCDSIGLANNHMCHSQMYESEAWGKARDVVRLPSPRGNGFWTQEIYYHILNTGLRITPSAGSASGVLPNPLGYNRVYAHVGNRESFDWPNWWKALKAGRSFVINGPILLVTAQGNLPGHVFQFSDSGSATLDLEISLTALDRVPEIEIVQNGAVVQKLPVGGVADSPITKTVSLTFEQSGWFLVRAVTDLKHTFRFASTAPFYVEVGEEPTRISRESTQFFLDWVEERIARVPEKLKDTEQQREVLKFHEEARVWWQDRLAQANAP